MGKNLDIFNTIYKNLDLMYVDTLNPAEVIGNGINAMLRSLDPYTEYYPEDKNKELEMMLTGKYAGIGSIIRKNLKLGNIVIDEPYEGTPAAEAGLKRGDEILSIDDSSMVGKSVSYVSERLRGEPGTTFALKVRRPSTGKEMTFKVTRRNIKLPAIPYYGMRPGGVGYICLSSFTEGCAKEMRRAFADLKGQGATKLVLDLRGNGGGSLAEAVDIISVGAKGADARRDARQAAAGQQGVQDEDRAGGHADAHRGDGQRRDGQRQRDNGRLAARPRPRRGARHAHLRQGPRAGADGPAVQRGHEAHHQQVLHTQRPLHTGHQLQALRRRVHRAHTRQPHTRVPHAGRA